MSLKAFVGEYDGESRFGCVVAAATLPKARYIIFAGLKEAGYSGIGFQHIRCYESKLYHHQQWAARQEKPCAVAPEYAKA